MISHSLNDTILTQYPNLGRLLQTIDSIESYEMVEPLSKITSLSKNKILILENTIPCLIEAGLFNHETLNALIDILTTKSPPIHSETVIESTNVNLNQNSLRKVKLSNHFTFFMKNDSSILGYGNQGYIYEGYDKETSLDEPAFIIKEYYSDYEKSKIALKEVKYNKLLGRHAFHYSHEDTNFMLTSWLPEKDLSNYRNKIISYSFERRLCWLNSMLCDLNTLHLNFRVHGDLKLSNMILDTAKDTLKLIDFGCAHKPGGLWKNHYSITGDNEKSLFSPDTRIVCETIAILFPELFELNNNIYQARENLNQDLGCLQQGIANLYQALNFIPVNKRCTIKDALDFTSQLLSKMNSLTSEVLNTIESNTINRDRITFEDAIHGRTTCR